MGQDCDLIWKDEKLHNQHKEKNMGRTIKISELKKFDVFLWEELLDERFVSMDAERFDSLDNEGDHYFYLNDMNKEVVVIGRMEFKEEPAHNF